MISRSLPTEEDRRNVFQTLLEAPNLRIIFDNFQMEKFSDNSPNSEERMRLLTFELGRRTQGLTEYDIAMIVKNQVQDSYFRGLYSNGQTEETLSLSAKSLLNAAYSNLHPTSAEAIFWQDDVDVHESRTVPVVLGLEDIKKELLSATAGSLPSSSSPSPSSASNPSQKLRDVNTMKKLLNLRSCSGQGDSSPSGDD